MSRLVLLALLFAAAAMAQPLAWSSLGAEQRALLAAFETQWDRLGESQQQQLLHNAEHWQRLDPAAQAHLLVRLRDWQNLPAPLRSRIRERFAVYRELEPERQQALSHHLEQWRAADPAERDAQRARFDALRPAQRRVLLMDDARRDRAEFAQQVFAFVPEGERPDTLAMLDALGEQERDLLESAVRRMAPWQREVLRQELLQLPAEARPGHLREQAKQR
jgi:hypothetical protein